MVTETINLQLNENKKQFAEIHDGVNSANIRTEVTL